MRLKHFIATHTFHSDKVKKEYLKFVKHRKKMLSGLKMYRRGRMHNYINYLLEKQIFSFATGTLKARVRLLRHYLKLELINIL